MGAGAAAVIVSLRNIVMDPSYKTLYLHLKQNPILEAMGVGWGFVFVAAVVVVFLPSLYVVIHFGPRWREERRIKKEQKANRAGEDA